MAKSYKYNCLKCDLMYELFTGVTDNCCFESYYCNKCEKVLDLSYDYASPPPTLDEVIKCTSCSNTNLKFIPGDVTNKKTGEITKHCCPRCNHEKHLKSAPMLWD